MKNYDPRTYQVTPSGHDVHHDVLLTNLVIEAFGEPTDGFIAEQLVPAVPVGKQSDKYAIIDRHRFQRAVPDTDTLRAPRTRAKRVEFQVSSDSYYAHNYALAAEMALEDIANSDDVFQLRSNHTRLVTTNLRVAQEVRIAGLLGSASNVGSGVSLSGTSKWSDFVNSSPLSDVTTAHATIRKNTGLIANVMVLDYDTWQIVRRHPELLDLYKFTQGGQLGLPQLADSFGVGRILIGQGVKENAREGGTSSMTNIWGNVCGLYYIGPATGMQSKTVALRFQWQPPNFPAPFVAGTRVEAGPGTKNVEIIEAGYFQSEKVVAPELGYVIDGTL